MRAQWACVQEFSIHLVNDIGLEECTKIVDASANSTLRMGGSSILEILPKRIEYMLYRMSDNPLNAPWASACSPEQATHVHVIARYVVSVPNPMGPVVDVVTTL